MTEEAVWFGQRRHNDMIARGVTAKALAVTYTSAGLFCHVRWFWGLLPYCPFYRIGTVVSLLGMFGGLVYGACTLFA